VVLCPGPGGLVATCPGGDMALCPGPGGFMVVCSEGDMAFCPGPEGIVVLYPWSSGFHGRLSWR